MRGQRVTLLDAVDADADGADEHEDDGDDVDEHGHQQDARRVGHGAVDVEEAVHQVEHHAEHDDVHAVPIGMPEKSVTKLKFPSRKSRLSLIFLLFLYLKANKWNIL